jgi:hypothetical protein
MDYSASSATATALVSGLILKPFHPEQVFSLVWRVLAMRGHMPKLLCRMVRPRHKEPRGADDLFGAIAWRPLESSSRIIADDRNH